MYSVIMNLIKFALYYLNLRLKILSGKSETTNPVSVKWRWKFWQINRELQARDKGGSVLRNDLENLRKKIFH